MSSGQSGGGVWSWRRELARDPPGRNKASQQGREHGQRKGKGEQLAVPPQLAAAGRMEPSVTFIEPNYVSGPKEPLRIPGRMRQGRLPGGPGWAGIQTEH